MVMIDLVDEKKSLGVISVTRVTESSRSCTAASAREGAYPQVIWHDANVSLVWCLLDPGAA
jgi:hypothetical protein